MAYLIKSRRILSSVLSAISFAVAVVISTLSMYGYSIADSDINVVQHQPRINPGVLIVVPHDGVSSTEFNRLISGHGGKSKKVGQSTIHVVNVPEHATDNIKSALEYEPNIKYVDYDYVVSPTMQPNDISYSSAWHLPKIGAPTAWDTSLGSGVTIAILDSGALGTHQDLVDNLVPGWNFYDNNSNTTDLTGHGTLVAGAAAATVNNMLGASGVAGKSKIMPIRITDLNGYGYYSTIVKGLVWATDRGARVANISYGGLAGSSTIWNAADYMRSKGGTVFVAGENSGTLLNYAASTSLVAVSATDINDNRTSWSSYGSYIDLAAPGASIYTTRNNGSYQFASGTSFASPVTAGVAALLYSIRPNLTDTDITDILTSTALERGTAGWDQYYGHGRVQADLAVAKALTYSPDVDVTPPSVSISTPLGGSTVSGTVPVEVLASDDVGISKVQLIVNGTLVAVSTASPYTFSWDSLGVSNGTVKLVARAFDIIGHSTDTMVTVNVANPVIEVPVDTIAPTVKITNPVTGNVSGKVIVTVEAADNSNAADIRLAVYINGVTKANGTGNMLSYIWNTKGTRQGSAIVTAVASDKAGNIASVDVKVNVVK